MDKGTTTTPFNMVVLNKLSRFHLAMDALKYVPRLRAQVYHRNGRRSRSATGQIPPLPFDHRDASAPGSSCACLRTTELCKSPVLRDPRTALSCGPPQAPSFRSWSHRANCPAVLKKVGLAGLVAGMSVAALVWFGVASGALGSVGPACLWPQR